MWHDVHAECDRHGQRAVVTKVPAHTTPELVQMGAHTMYRWYGNTVADRIAAKAALDGQIFERAAEAYMKELALHTRCCDE